MDRPPRDPTARPNRPVSTGRRILAGFVLLGLALLGTWVASNPIVGAVVASVVAIALVGPRVAKAGRCLAVCREVTIDLGGLATITVRRTQ